MSKSEKPTLLPPTNGIIEIGVDEVGRGCLLGPVVTAAVALPPTDTMVEKEWSEIRDSKKVSARNRCRLNKFLREKCVSYGIGMVFEEDIDRMNILRATMKAMHLAIDDCIRKMPAAQQVSGHPIELLIDGPHFRPYAPPGQEDEWYIKGARCVVNGDAVHMSIAAASIIAKEERDSFIVNLVTKNPSLEKYDLVKNKGYGTSKHMKALVAHGASEFHRKSFRPVREAMLPKLGTCPALDLTDDSSELSEDNDEHSKSHDR